MEAKFKPPKNKMQERFRKKILQAVKLHVPTLTPGGGGSGIINFKFEPGTMKNK